MVRRSRGRQKVNMVKMTNEYNLQVTFCKRRSGLFKKASELSTLCGANIAVIIFSPGGKSFSFGHPNVDAVIDRVLNFTSSRFHHNNMQFTETQPDRAIQDLNNHLAEALTQLEKEENKNKSLKQKRKESQDSGNWWEKSVEELDLAQLSELVSGLESLRKEVATEVSKHFQSNDPRHNFYFGSSSNAVVRNSSGTSIRLDLFTHQRMMSMSTSDYNHNVIVQNHTPPFGINGNDTRRLTPRYNMSFKTEQNQDDSRFF